MLAAAQMKRLWSGSARKSYSARRVKSERLAAEPIYMQLKKAERQRELYLGHLEAVQK